MAHIEVDFITYIVKGMVGKPDAVIVDRIVDDKGTLLTLTVDPEDLGRVIGKRGATAQSLRTLLRALGTKNDERYNLKIADNGVPKPERTDRRDEPRDSQKRDYREDKPRDSNDSKESEPVEDSVTKEEPKSGGNWGDDDTDSSPDVKAEAPVEEPKKEGLAARLKKELSGFDDLDI